MLKHFFKKFFIHCISMNLQTSTLNSYENRLNIFNDYLNNAGYKNITDITADTIREFLAQKANCVSKSTLWAYYITLNIFFKFLYRNNLISNNIIENVSKPRKKKHTLRVFNNTEIKLILNYFDKSTFIGFRNYAIMCTLFSTGIRISELCNLNCVDIMFELDMINIIGKGDKQRHIPITATLKKIMLKYFKMRNEYITEKSLNQSRFYFITRTGNKINRDNIEWLFIKIKNSYNIQGDRFSAHTFRHTFAKTYLLNGGDIFSLQKILGHEKIETTRQYIDLNETEIKIQNEKYNPLDNTRWQYY